MPPLSCQTRSKAPSQDHGTILAFLVFIFLNQYSVIQSHGLLARAIRSYSIWFWAIELQSGCFSNKVEFEYGAEENLIVDHPSLEQKRVASVSSGGEMDVVLQIWL